MSKIILYGIISCCCFGSAVSQLQISSSWDSSSVPCNVTLVEDGKNHIQGISKLHDCSIQVYAPPWTIMLLTILQGNLTGTDYLYLKRQGGLDRCTNRYVVFHEAKHICTAKLYHRYIRVSIRGHIKLSIGSLQEVKNKEWTTDECVESMSEVGAYSNDTIMPGCNAVHGYDEVFTLSCKWLRPAGHAHCYIWTYAPNGCSHRLGIRSTNCTGGTGEHYETFIIVPANNENKLSSQTAGLFSSLGNLTLLDLSRNGLQYIEVGVFNGLSNLSGLEIGGNDLHSLTVGVFSGLRKLTKLCLDYNELQSLEAGIFNGLSNLIQLDISHNRLHSLVQGVFNGLRRLKSLDMYGNMEVMIREKVFLDLPLSVIIYCECLHTDSTKYQCLRYDDITRHSSCRLLSYISVTVFMLIFSFGAILGNIFVLFWKRRHRERDNRVQRILLSNLAVSDLLMGIYMLFIVGADIHYGDTYYGSSMLITWQYSPPCIIAGILAIVSSEASVLFLTVISVDRCICIKFPFTNRRLRNKSTKIAATIIWFLAFLFAVLPYAVIAFLTFETAKWYTTTVYGSSDMCIGLPLTQMRRYIVETLYSEAKRAVDLTSNSKSGLYYSVVLFLGVNLVCFLIILGCYIEIIRVVKSSSREARRGQHMQEQLQMTAKVTAIIATDFCCWVPIIITSILGQSGVIEVNTTVYSVITTFALPINSVINPFLYTIIYVIAERWQQRKDQRNMRNEHIALQAQRRRARDREEN